MKDTMIHVHAKFQIEKKMCEDVIKMRGEGVWRICGLICGELGL
jgi:hypothetical protein